MRGLALHRAAKPLLHLGSGNRIERRKRLVEKQHVLLRHQGAEKRHALSHPARQLRRHGALERGKTEALEERLSPSAGVGSRDAAILERNRGVVERRAPRQQQVSLRHEGAASEPLGRLDLGSDGDVSLVRLEQTGDAREERRLAAPARPDEADPALPRNDEVDVCESDGVPECPPNALHDDAGDVGRRARA